VALFLATDSLRAFFCQPVLVTQRVHFLGIWAGSLKRADLATPQIRPLGAFLGFPGVMDLEVSGDCALPSPREARFLPCCGTVLAPCPCRWAAICLPAFLV